MTTPTTGRVLVVDDDVFFLRACAAMLARAGLAVETASDSKEALRRIALGRYDTIVSDLCMPGGDGLSLLRAAREHDATVPFVLMTGAPDVTSAISAVNLGAMKYLPKPFEAEQFVHAVVEAVHRRARAEDVEALSLQLDAALAGLWMAYQPIVSYSERRPHAYEALLRTSAAGVKGPGEILELAEKTHRLFDLGRRVRAAVARDITQLADDLLVFVNLHPADLEDPELYDAASPLAAHASRVVLELTERASVAHDETLDLHIAALHALGYRVAVDDLGAGYAGLTTLARVKPEYVKLDGSLIRDVDSSKTNQAVVTSLVLLAQQLDMLVIAEAIETPAELATLRRLGVEYLQGYLFARPGKPFVGIDDSQFLPRSAVAPHGRALVA